LSNLQINNNLIYDAAIALNVLRGMLLVCVWECLYVCAVTACNTYT